MTFSIIIPVYNVAHSVSARSATRRSGSGDTYLHECLDSVLAQTFSDWEAICIDDGSTDGSGAILDSYASLDERIKVFHCMNSGVSCARNSAMDKSSGDFLVFLDGDDLLERTLLEDLAKIIVSKPAVDIVGFGVETLEVDGERRPYSRTCESGCFTGGQILASIRSGKGRYLWSVWDKVFRRGLICGQGIRFDVSLANGEDSLFAQEAIAYAGEVILRPDIIGYVYRRRAGSAVAEVRTALPKDPFVAFRRLLFIWKRLRTKGLRIVVGYNAVLLFSLGKVGNFAPEVRLCAIDFLLDSSEFIESVIPFLILHGTVKARVAAMAYICLPKCVKRKLLQRI